MWTSWFFSKQFFKHEKNCGLPSYTSDTSRLYKMNKTTLFIPSLLLFGFLRGPFPKLLCWCQACPWLSPSLNPTSRSHTFCVPCTSTCCSAQINLSALSPSPSSLPCAGQWHHHPDIPAKYFRICSSFLLFTPFKLLSVTPKGSLVSVHSPISFSLVVT